MPLAELLRMTARKRWHILAASALAFAAAAGIYRLFSPRQYVAHASFHVEGGTVRPTTLSGLAAQFGIDVPQVDQSQSPDFFSQLVGSRTVLSDVLTRPYVDTALNSSTPIDLATAFHVPAEAPLRRRDDLLREITNRLAVTVGLRTGIISIDLEAPSRYLAAAMVDQMLQSVNKFTVSARQQRAEQERQFATARLQASDSALRAAEDQLVAFAESNRVAASPELQTRRERLEQAVQMRQQLFVSLSEMYEQANLQALRSTPAVMVIDSAVAMARPVSRHVVGWSLLGALVGAIGSLALLALWAIRPLVGKSAAARS